MNTHGVTDRIVAGVGRVTRGLSCSLGAYFSELLIACTISPTLPMAAAMHPACILWVPWVHHVFKVDPPFSTQSLKVDKRGGVLQLECSYYHALL